MVTETESIDEAEQLWLERRAEDELAAAQAALHPKAVRAHFLLASNYLDRLYGPDGADKADRAGASR